MKYVARKLQEVTAWKYEQGKDVPVWVARKCHDRGDGQLTASSIAGPLPINIGDYVVLADEETNSVVVVTGSDFEAEFEPAAVA